MSPQKQMLNSQENILPKQMAKIPIKFKRVAAAFDEAVKSRRPCESSSGSEYWPESGTDLSDLVNSFLENGDGNQEDQFDIHVNESKVEVNKDTDDTRDVNWVSDNDAEGDDLERKETLKGLLLECGIDGDNCGVKQKIYDEIDDGLKIIGELSDVSTSRNSLKRRLMAHLRDKGFDAGLCKSRWEKTGRMPAGSYEYIDVKVGQVRYIIEVCLTGELEIARPTARYMALLGMIPPVLVIEKPQVLKQIMRLMSGAMRESLKHVSMHVPPWRRQGYLEAKYFSPYKRTTNREPSGRTTKGERGGLAKKQSTIGFESDLVRVPCYSYCRGDDFASKVGVRVGLLAAALQGK